jgi:single-stranded DNA-binding protein
VSNHTIIGNITKSPALNFGSNGKAWAYFSIAENHGKDKPAVSWDCKIFGEQAEYAAELEQGTRVVVNGHFELETYTPAEGPNAGVEQRKVRFYVDEIAASLRWARVTVEKVRREQPANATDHSVGTGSHPEGRYRVSAEGVSPAGATSAIAL